MAKYADITPFYEWLDWLEKESNTPYGEYETLMLYEIRYKLDDLPEVVRCKDCKMWIRNCGFTDSPNGHCFCHDIETNGHDFCSYGERKYNENNS